MNKILVLAKATLYTYKGEHLIRLFWDGWGNFFNATIIITKKGKGELKFTKEDIRLKIPMNRLALSALIEELRTLSEKEEGYTFKLESKKPIWEDNVMTDRVTLAGTLELGRRKMDSGDLVNYVLATDPSGKRYALQFTTSENITLFRNGKQLSVSEESVLMTHAYYRTLKAVIDSFPETYPNPEKELPETKSIRGEKANTTTSTDSDADDLF